MQQIYTMLGNMPYDSLSILLGTILNCHAAMRKRSAKYVQRLLPSDHNPNRASTLKERVTLFSDNRDEVLHHLITIDETWIPHKTVEILLQPNSEFI